MTSMSALDVLKNSGPYFDLYERLRDALLGTGSLPSQDPGLPVDFEMTSVEQYARAIAKWAEPEVELALSFPLVLVVQSIAAQGGVWLTIPQPGGDILRVPLIQQAVVVAQSGYGKSTAIRPLVRLIDELNDLGVPGRRQMTADKLAGLIPVGASPEVIEFWGKVGSLGGCDRLLIDSGTPEGVRRALLRGGSVAGVLTAEPDIFREISGYAKDGQGTFRWLLDGWAAEKIAVARAQTEMTIPRAALPYAIMVQPGAFDDFNLGGSSAWGGGKGVGVSAVDRGLYGRSWLVRVEGWKPNKHGFGLRPMDLPPGQLGVGGEVDTARAKLSTGLKALAARTDDYRVQMALRVGWEERKEEAALLPNVGLPPSLPPQAGMTLAEDARFAYSILQNLRLALVDDVTRENWGQNADDEPGGEGMLSRVMMPLVTRLTEHGLRLGMALQLAKDPASKQLTGPALQDAVLRILPWLVEHWAAEMRRYLTGAAEQAVESEVKQNPRGVSLTYQGVLARAVKKWEEEKGVDTSFLKSDILERGRSSLGRKTRTEGRPRLQEVWDAWQESGLIVKAEEGKGSNSGRFLRAPGAVLD